MYDIVIIGGGPAGMTAALYAKRGGLKTLLIESMMTGGQVNTTPEVENFPGFVKVGGFELSLKMNEQCMAAGVEFAYEQVKSLKLDGEIKQIATNKRTIESKSVVIATGASPRKTDVETEEKYVGRGVSYCAHCDGNFFRNKDVAVIGGGNTALTDALYLANICNKVYIVHRRNEFRGSKVLVERLHEKSNVEFVLDCIPHAISGEQAVESLTVQSKTDGSERELKVSGIFVAVGVLPNNELFKDVLKTDNGGFVITDENMETSESMVYAIGDVRAKPLRQIVTACADGAVASSSIIEKIS